VEAGYVIKQPFWVRHTKKDPGASTHYSNCFYSKLLRAVFHTGGTLYGVFKMKDSWDIPILHIEANEFVGNIFIQSAAEHLTCEKCY
jgi:hypothetical protein